MVYRHLDRTLLSVVCALLFGVGCSSGDDNMMQGPLTSGGVGAAGMAAGASAAGTTGGTGIGNEGAGQGGEAGEAGAAGMVDPTAGAGGMAAGEGGAAGQAGEAGTAGMAGGMSEGPQPNPDGVDPLPPLPDAMALPIVFVHGFAGSAQQYESQAQRFVMNGYPQERIRAYDHDGAGFDFAGYANGVDAVIDQALADFGVSKVYLVGHSRGTIVSSSYLGNATRAAKVAKYISLDGAGCGGIPAAVPCLEPSQGNLPGQAHVEVATSAESFAMQYEFLIGSAPAVQDIAPQKEVVTLNGRAVNFPANTGRPNTNLEVWEIDEATGHRVGDAPVSMAALTADGGFGPLTVDSRKLYEFALVPIAPATGATHHLYMQRFLRDSDLVRLLSGDAMSPTRMNTNTSDNHSSIILMRMREWYATGAADTIEIGTTSPGRGDQAPVNAMQRYIGNATIGLHIHDAAASPGDSTLTALPFFSAQAFQNGVDLFMPATDPPDGTITITNVPRGDTSKPQVIRVPNWASSGHAMTVFFADYAQ